MKVEQSWAEALNISPEKLNEWSSQVPPGKPLLVWCLETGHVSAPEYFGWAVDNFGLPVLSASFFGEMDRSFFDQNKASGQWSPWFMPLQQWDGITYIACVEPPTERAEQTCYVLADPRAMAELWGEDSAPQTEMPPPLDAPEGLRLDPPKVPFKLNLDETNLLIGGVPEPEAPPPLNRPPPPEELTNLTSINAEPTTVDDGIVQLDENLTGMTGMNLTPATVVVEALPQASSASEPDALASVFASLGQTFEHSCLIRFSDDGQARLYKASPSLKPPAGGAKAVLNLSQPSFLRIVVKTLLPYHGYLVASPTHQEFFAGLGLSEAPGCVTAAPLRVNGKLWGALLAMGPESLQAMTNLELVTAAAEQLIAALGAVWSKAA